MISGIIQVLKSGGRWIDAPPDYGPRKTLYNRFVRWAEKGVWVGVFDALAQAGGPPAQVLIDCSAVKAHRSAAGGKGGRKNQAIGRSRGGRTTKIHALTDAECRPHRLHAHWRPGRRLHGRRQLLEPTSRLRYPARATRATIANAIRRQVEEQGALANIPPKANRKWKSCFSPFLYRNRNAIERMFCRLKDFRRVATRYDRSAANFLATVCIAATVSYWLRFEA